MGTYNGIAILKKDPFLWKMDIDMHIALHGGSVKLSGGRIIFCLTKILVG